MRARLHMWKKSCNFAPEFENTYILYIWKTPFILWCRPIMRRRTSKKWFNSGTLYASASTQRDIQAGGQTQFRSRRYSAVPLSLCDGARRRLYLPNGQWRSDLAGGVLADVGEPREIRLSDWYARWSSGRRKSCLRDQDFAFCRLADVPLLG